MPSLLKTCYEHNKPLIKQKKSNHWLREKKVRVSHLALSAGTKVEFPGGLLPIDVGYFFHARTPRQRHPNVSTGVAAPEGRRRGRMVGRSIFGEGSKSTRSQSQ